MNKYLRDTEESILSRKVFDGGLNFIAKSFCAHMPLSVCTWVVWLYMHMYRPMSGAALSRSLLKSQAHQLGKWLTRKFQDPSVFAPPNWAYRSVPPDLAFTWVLAAWPQVFMFVHSGLYELSHLPSSHYYNLSSSFLKTKWSDDFVRYPLQGMCSIFSASASSFLLVTANRRWYKQQGQIQMLWCQDPWVK